MMTLKNKRVFITGASSGIGAACAAEFAKAGAHLLLGARRLDKLEALSTQLKNKHHAAEIHFVELDVRQLSIVKMTLNALSAEWKHIDVLINNAGLAAGLETLQEGNIADWDDMIDTNLKGLLYVTRTILPGMVERDKGHIINIGSIAGHIVYPKGAVYCATKQAVNALTHGLRMDLFGKKIRVTTVDPGAVETDFSLVRFKGNKKRAEAVYKGMQPLTPEDVARVVAFCAAQPLHVNLSEVIIMPTDQAAPTMVSRTSS